MNFQGFMNFQSFADFLESKENTKIDSLVYRNEIPNDKINHKKANHIRIVINGFEINLNPNGTYEIENFN